MSASEKKVTPLVRQRLALWLATGLGVGLVTPAPGTIAGLWGLGLAAFATSTSSLETQLALIAISALVAVPICGAAARMLGADHDPGAIVLDEIVALPVVFTGVSHMSWTILLVGYVLFRICDISKLGLARAAERLPEGWGIVADDIVAALMACVLLHALAWADRAIGYEWLTL